MSDHRAVLTENVRELAAVRRDAMDALDAVQEQILVHGPLRLDGHPNEQLVQQLRGIARLCHEVAERTAEIVSVLDQINRLRGRLAEAGQVLPSLPAGLGVPIAPDDTPADVLPSSPLESDLLRQVKAERDALARQLAQRLADPAV